MSPFDSCCVLSPTGRGNLNDKPLEPSVFHDLLHSYHGEARVVTFMSLYMREYIIPNHTPHDFNVCDILSQVVMTIIVAFILDAFVFRMNYSRKNREPLENPEGEGGRERERERESVHACVGIL